MNETLARAEAIFIDEYGRTVINDEELLKLISGANMEQYISSEHCNTGCGSNGACYNSGCKK